MSERPMITKQHYETQTTMAVRLPIVSLHDFENIDLDSLLRFKKLKKKQLGNFEESKRFAYLQIANLNLGFALAGLRMEIEECLLQMARRKGVPVGTETVSDLLFLLRQNDIFTQEEFKALNRVRSLLDPVIHRRMKADKLVVTWLMNVSRDLLDALDVKLDSLA